MSSLICAFIGKLKCAGLSNVLIVAVSLEVMNVRVCHLSLKSTTAFTPSGGEKVLCAGLHQVKQCGGDLTPSLTPAVNIDCLYQKLRTAELHEIRGSLCFPHHF